MKFIIHAGLHKTGSTSIQNFCGENKKELKDCRIYYPSFDTNSWFNHSIPLSLICMENHGIRSHSVVSIFKTEADRALASNKFLNFFKNEIQKIDEIDSALISGEDISVFNLNELYRFKEFLFSCGATEVEIIIFVRRPIDFLLSNSQELVRAGLYQFGEAIRLGNLQQVSLKIPKLQNVFGKENVRINNYDSVINNDNGIINYFLSLLEIDLRQVNEFKINSAMGLEKCLILSALVKNNGKDDIQEMGALLDNAGSKIIANRQINEYIAPLNQADCEFLNMHNQISWDTSNVISKAEIDLTVFDVYLNKLCHHDGTISPKTVILTIIQDIRDLYPEIADALSKNYNALIFS